jgi:uncharacterized membrane protein
MQDVLRRKLIMPVFVLGFLTAGIALICLAVPLIHRKVPPNLLYGFRVRQTLDDSSVWYPANEYAAWQFVWLGIAGIIVTIAAYFIPGIQLDLYASIIGVFYLVGILIAAVRSYAFLRTLTKDKPNPPSKLS